jgi:heme/copper-type cytochrome/quinol oxidase subunit 4
LQHLGNLLVATTKRDKLPLHMKIYIFTCLYKKKKKKNAKTTKYIVTFIPSILLVPFTLPIAHVAIYPTKTYSLVYTTQKKCQNNKIHCNFHSFHSTCPIYPSNSSRGHISCKTYSLVYTHKKMPKQQKYIVIFIPSISLVPFTLPIAHVVIYPAKL